MDKDAVTEIFVGLEMNKSAFFDVEGCNPLNYNNDSQLVCRDPKVGCRILQRTTIFYLSFNYISFIGSLNT